jgi:2',3'-cyclic-nucleotide 2'-phosphodiesterase (5'-nucleotidase family)
MPTTIQPGTLRLKKGVPNPAGAENIELFLLEGDPSTQPITEVVPAPGVQLPTRSDTLSDSGFRLRVLHFNDLHGHIVRFRPGGNRPIFSRIVYRIRELRRLYRNEPKLGVLVLSAGDDFGGTVLDELLGDDPESYIVHAGYRLYSEAGVDVGTIGNHDLDKGSQLLSHAMEQDARFPILSANLVGSQWLCEQCCLAAILVIKGVRVGIIGLTTPATIRPQQDTGLQIVNPIQAARNLLPAIKPLSDIQIILSHLGYSLTSTSASVIEAGDVELARALPYGGVHLIVGGHTHDVLNHHSLTADHIINGIPIVQAGALGEYLGEVDITVHETAAAVTSVRLTQTVDVLTDKDFEGKEVQSVVKLAQPLFQRHLGEVANQPDLSTIMVRNAFAANESAMANFITDALVTRCRANGYNADLGVVDSSCVRCGLTVNGELTYGNWFQVMPFADTIRLCWLTGEQLWELIKDNVRRIDRPDEPHTERGFLQFSRQVRYVVELGKTRLEARPLQITIDDIPIEQQLERTFLVACTNYVRVKAQPWEAFAASFHDMVLMDLQQNPPLETHLFLRDEMVAHIRENGGVTEAGGAKRDGRLTVQ